MNRPRPTADVPPLDWPHYRVGPVAAVVRGYQKWSVPAGRASRSEFWWWTLFANAGWWVLGMLAGLSTLTQPAAPDGTRPIGVLGVVLLILAGVLLLSTVVPSIMITIRRLHDVGLSGWYYLLNLIPYLGYVVVLIICIQATSPSASTYGPPYPAGPSTQVPYPQGPYAQPYPESTYPQGPYPPDQP